MVYNENALYQGELWCAYELKDEDGKYIEDKRLHMRKESQKNRFRCPDCGENLILCAGPVMEPHFRHHDKSQCLGRARTGSGRFPEIRMRLYHLCRRSFPKAEIDFQVKFTTGVTADILIRRKEPGTGNEEQIAVEYVAQDEKLADWEQKHQYYKEGGIVDVWILSGYHRPLHTITTFEYMVTKASPILKLLDTNNWTIDLKQKCSRDRLITHRYDIAELKLNTSGEFICNFTWLRDRELAAAAKLEEQKRQGELRYQEDLRLELEDRARMRKEPFYQSDQTGEEKSSSTNKVIRRKAGEGRITKATMKMPALDEWWDLPVLNGTDGQIRTGNMARYRYLRSVNEQASRLSEDDRDVILSKAVYRLEKLIQATQWK